jgi:hypothetical protein
MNTSVYAAILLGVCALVLSLAMARLLGFGKVQIGVAPVPSFRQGSNSSLSGPMATTITEVALAPLLTELRKTPDDERTLFFRRRGDDSSGLCITWESGHFVATLQVDPAQYAGAEEFATANSIRIVEQSVVNAGVPGFEYRTIDFRLEGSTGFVPIVLKALRDACGFGEDELVEMALQ